MKEMKKLQTNKRIQNREGSVLIWVMLTSIILLLIILTVFSVTSTSFHRTINKQVDTQAYYTARSLNERIVALLQNTPEHPVTDTLTDGAHLIAHLAAATGKTVTEEYTAAQLGNGLGSGKVTLAMNSRKTEILITTTGYYGEHEETIHTKMALTGQSSLTYLTDKFPDQSSSPFMAKNPQTGKSPLETYVAREVALNALSPDSSPVIVGNEALGTDTAMAPYNNNTTDQETADAGIPSAASTKELTWINRSSDQSTVLGTTYYPIKPNAASTYSDIRRLVTPRNGRWTINPLQAGGSATSTTHANTAIAESNTHPVMLSMGDFAGKDLMIRLGGYNQGSLKNDTAYYNALIAFDFTDNEGQTVNNPDVEYYDNNIYTATPQQLWHPQKWNSMTVFTQNTADATINAGVDTRLVFGPFLHKYNEYGDFWNYGRYTGNPWYGQAAGDYNKAFPGNNLDSDTAIAREGMAYIPEYYGADFNMFFSDTINKNVLITQGVNILGDKDKNAVVFSRRGLELGGGLIKSTSTYNDDLGQTTRNVNSTIDGYSYGYAPLTPNYFGITTRYSQIIYNTDIVLLTPNGATTPRQSRIFDATLPNDGAYATNNNFSDTENKRFSPTVRIIGGSIYVGAGQTLTIDGGRINPLNGEKTQEVRPDSITVADGGTLNIRGRRDVGGTINNGNSAYANVNTNIYVEGGGTLNLEDGAYLAGNVHAAGTDSKKATVNISDTVHFDPANNGGIHAWENATVTLNVSAAFYGNITVGANGKMLIDGSSTNNTILAGDVHCLGKLTVNGTFTLKALDKNLTTGVAPMDVVLVDDPATTDVDESKPMYHGIILYDISEIGTGSLEILGTNTVISGADYTGSVNPNPRLHTFVPYPTITGTRANKIFCNDHDPSNNICSHWTVSNRIWLKQSTTGGG